MATNELDVFRIKMFLNANANIRRISVFIAVILFLVGLMLGCDGNVFWSLLGVGSAWWRALCA